MIILRQNDYTTFDKISKEAQEFNRKFPKSNLRFEIQDSDMDPNTKFIFLGYDDQPFIFLGHNKSTGEWFEQPYGTWKKFRLSRPVKESDVLNKMRESLISGVEEDNLTTNPTDYDYRIQKSAYNYLQKRFSLLSRSV